MNEAHPVSRKKLVLAIVLGIGVAAVVIAGISLAKLVLYESSGVATIRSAVGKMVVLRQERGRQYRGKLAYAKYGPNDKWGWFELRIKIEDQVDTSLGPMELDKLKVETYSPDQDR